MSIVKFPLLATEVSFLGSSTSNGTGDWTCRMPQIAWAPTSMVRFPLIMPMKKTFTRSLTFTWRSGFETQPGRQAVPEELLVQLETPETEVGELSATWFEADPVTRPVPL